MYYRLYVQMWSCCLLTCCGTDGYAGKETVTLVDGGSYMDSAEVFAMIRGLAYYNYMIAVVSLNLYYLHVVATFT